MRRINRLSRAWVLALVLVMTTCEQPASGGGTQDNEGVFVPVTGISGDLPKTLVTGYPVNLNEYAAVEPEDATRKTIIWKITDSASVGVTAEDAADGSFTPMIAGTMTVTATITGGRGTEDFTADYTITVIAGEDFIPATGIEGVPERCFAGGAIDLDTVTVTPADATYNRIAWTVTGAAIVNNKITAPAAGDLTLRGTVSNPVTAAYTRDFTVTVMPPPTAWTKAANVPAQAPGEIQTVCYGYDDNGDGLFVTGSRDNDGVIAYSADGITWTGLNSAETTFQDTINGNTVKHFVHVKYLNGTFWAVGGGGHMARSEDGRTWTRVADPGITLNIVDIAYGINENGGILVAGGDQGTMSYSTDNGATWTANNQVAYLSTAYEVANFKAIGWGAGRFLAVGQLAKAIYSADGIHWKNISETMKNEIIGTDAGGFAGMSVATYGGGQYVIASQGIVALSPDCENWERIDMAEFGFPRGHRYGWINSLIYADGLFILGGADGEAAYSADGRGWTPVTTTNRIFHNFHFINGIAHDGKGTFVAVGATCTDDPCPYPPDSLFESDHRGNAGCIAYIRP